MLAEGAGNESLSEMEQIKMKMKKVTQARLKR